MNTQAISEAYYDEDKYEQAKEAERIAYINGNIELSKAYGLICDLLMLKIHAENMETYK